jgi:mono/diheme cytochrome c family protein
VKRVLGIVTAAGIIVSTLSTLSLGPKGFPSVYTAEQATAGEREVQNNAFGRCSDCHANGLAGRVGNPDELPALSSLPEDIQTRVRNGGGVPELAGQRFLQRWATRSTMDFSTEMRKRFAGSLSEETRLNIMAYILRLNGALPGSKQLTESTDVQINRLAKQSSD